MRVISDRALASLPMKSKRILIQLQASSNRDGDVNLVNLVNLNEVVYFEISDRVHMIYLDSAMLEDAKAAVAMGWVKGITTNPTLLAKSNRQPEECLEELTTICPGELYYQLCADNFEDMVTESHRAAEIVGNKLVLKIPATKLGFRVTARLAPEIDCSVTAIYSPAQAAIASEAGAKYAIAYVNRATRLLGDGLELVRSMSQILKNSPTQILAASLKSPEEAAATLIAGADCITVPLSILQAMTTHELSSKTVAEFAAGGTGIAIEPS